ncbi:LysR family transcriptional regulator [Methyloversatilis thermotolerans]|uniref:LysR family transcriptional regulator n=1 Tax=Methyloversatilis thermotolerans TaxID=1346290 RepID=UPI000377971D|nr:LysR family transcriptional regulator [Methyloversatilis thermotolerans]
MFFRQLEYLVTLAREKHFARAAKACHVSQPALSSAIRNLEEELGVTIVLRGQRFLGFTAEGERILAWARQSLAALSGLRQEASVAQAHLTGVLRLGVIPTSSVIVSLLTGACRSQHPELAYSVLSLSTDEILRRVDEYELDAGVCYLDDVDEAGFRVLPLFQERYMLLAPAGSREAALDTISWKEAAALPLCLLTPNMQNRQIVNAGFRRASAQPFVAVETDSVSALLAQVRHAGLYSVVPHSLTDLAIAPTGTTMVSLKPLFSRVIGLVLRDPDPLPALPPLPSALWHIASGLDLHRRFGTPSAGG